MYALLNLFLMIINFYIFCVIAMVILSWLITFNILNTQNQFVAMLSEFFYKITDLTLRPIRRFIPDIGGIDLSPLVLIFFLYFLKNLIIEYGFIH